MSGEFSIIVPEAATNKVVNPSFEIDVTTGWGALAGATLTRDTTVARFGYASLKVVTPNVAINEGAGTLTGTSGMAVTAGNSYTASCYLYSTASPSLTFDVRWYDAAGATLSTSNTTQTWIGSNRWNRYSVTYTAPANAAFAAIFIRTAVQAGVTFYIDAVQFEQSAYVTTYIDGDRVDPNVPGGYRWTGVAHGSTSTRSAQVRSGGRENVIDTTYSVFADTDGTTGQGVAPLENITQEYALQPGGEFQETKIHPRVMTLRCKIPGGDLATVHSRRKALWNVIKPDLCAPTQPFVLVYNEAQASTKLYGSFYYESGMDVTGNDLALLSSFDLRLVAVDPFWYEDTQEQTALTVQATLASDQAFGRINGTWQRFGTGVNDVITCFAVDYAHNRIYFGGKATTMNGVTVNGIGYWDGTTFQPLGAATKGIGVAGTGGVNSIAIAPNGDVWAAGTFTTAGGSATKGLAKWAYPGTSAPTVWATSTTWTQINSVVIDRNYRVYIGGKYTEFNGTANCSYFCYTSDQGTTFVAPTTTIATGGTNWVTCLIVDIDGLGIYLGGDYTAIAGVANTVRIAKYSGGAFTALSAGFPSGIVNGFAVQPDGTLYIGGSIPGNLVKWNGSVLISLAASGNTQQLSWDYINNLLFFVYSSSTTGVSFYNGSKFSTFDLTTSGLTAGAVLINRLNSDIYFGLSGAASTTESGITTVTPTSTAATYPVIVVSATTTAASSTTLNWLENQTTRQRLYINGLALQTGETLTIDLRPNQKKFISNWRGDLTSYVLSNSDLANFKLLPGANTIALYLTGTLTGAFAVIQDVPQHLAVDGGAA